MSKGLQHKEALLCIVFDISQLRLLAAFINLFLHIIHIP